MNGLFIQQWEKIKRKLHLDNGDVAQLMHLIDHNVDNPRVVLDLLHKLYNLTKLRDIQMLEARVQQEQQPTRRSFLKGLGKGFAAALLLNPLELFAAESEKNDISQDVYDLMMEQPLFGRFMQQKEYGMGPKSATTMQIEGQRIIFEVQAYYAHGPIKNDTSLYYGFKAFMRLPDYGKDTYHYFDTNGAKPRTIKGIKIESYVTTYILKKRGEKIIDETHYDKPNKKTNAKAVAIIRYALTQPQ